MSYPGDIIKEFQHARAGQRTSDLGHRNQFWDQPAPEFNPCHSDIMLRGE